MRLEAQEVAAIKAAAREAFGEGVIVRLFGSRVHDHLRGGDIDLLVEVEGELPGVVQESRFLDELFATMDERRIDIVYSSRQREPSLFARIAARDAVLLS